MQTTKESLRAKLQNQQAAAGQQAVESKPAVVLPVLDMAKAEAWYLDEEKYPETELIEITLSHPTESQRESMNAVAIASVRILGAYLSGIQVRFDNGRLFITEPGHSVEGAGFNGNNRWYKHFNLGAHASALILRMVQPMLIFPEGEEQDYVVEQPEEL